MYRSVKLSLITKVKLNNRQKAIGTILLFPWYLYFAPSFFNFLIKLYVTYVNDNLTSETINTYFNVLIALPFFLFTCSYFEYFSKSFHTIFILSPRVIVAVIYGWITTAKRKKDKSLFLSRNIVFCKGNHFPQNTYTGSPIYLPIFSLL